MLDIFKCALGHDCKNLELTSKEESWKIGKLFQTGKTYRQSYKCAPKLLWNSDQAENIQCIFDEKSNLSSIVSLQ